MKIPFERTIAGAYRFAFSNVLSIVGIGWFPFLLAGAVCAGIVYALLPQLDLLLSMDSSRPDPTEVAHRIMPLLGALPVFFAVILVAVSMVNVGVIRKALGLHPEPVYIYFSLGAQVWRLIGAYLLLMVLAWGVMLALALGVGAVSFLLSNISPGIQNLATALLTVAAIFWAVYAVVRVQFFLPAVVVAENHIGLRRSWNLGRGNFWRIVGVVLAVVIPVAVVASTINQVIFQVSVVPRLVASGSPPGLFHQPVTPDEMRRFIATLFSASFRVWPFFAAIQLLQTILSTGLSLGAVATAYKLVTDTESVTSKSEPEEAHA